MIIRTRTLDWAVDHVMCCRAYNPIITCVACFTSANPILHARAGELSSAPFPTASTCVGPTKYVLLLPFPFSAWCFYCSTVFSFIIILHIRWEGGGLRAAMCRAVSRITPPPHRGHRGAGCRFWAVPSSTWQVLAAAWRTGASRWELRRLSASSWR